MTCPRFPARAPVAGDGPPSVGRGLVSYGPSRPIRLLVADDDARVRAAIGQTVALEADLVIVADAADGAAALALAEATGPSVALVDVLIPDEATGLALVASLCRRPGCAVVAMSVRSGLRRAALAAGAVAFAEKAATSTPSWTRSGPRHHPTTPEPVTSGPRPARPGHGRGRASAHPAPTS